MKKETKNVPLRTGMLHSTIDYEKLIELQANSECGFNNKIKETNEKAKTKILKRNPIKHGGGKRDKC